MVGKRLTNEEFVDRAKIKHGGLYNYSNVEYVNMFTKVKIICSKHGEFLQRPHRHLCGDGCPTCAYLSIGDKIKLDVNLVIDRAKSIHGDKYDYSLVEYKTYKTKVKIICPIHGEFQQSMSAHIDMESGCKRCGYNKISAKKSKTQEKFIEEAKKIHGDKYDYSKVSYINTMDYVEIICPKHGEFLQKPYKHLQDRGCPVCRESKLEKKIRLLLLKEEIEFVYGYSKKNGAEWLGKQSLDFYLPKYNLAIECQGEQHFRPVGFGSKDEEYINNIFNKVLKRDRDKYNKCISEGVKILYFTENVDVINCPYIDTVYLNTFDLIDKIRSYE